MPSPLSSPAPALGLLLLCQCAGTPNLPRAVELGPADRVRVVYQAAQVTMVLRTLDDNNNSRQALSSSGDPNAKICSVDNLQNLLDLLTQYGFFARATQGEPTEPEVLTVEINGQELTWSKPAIDISVQGQRRMIDFLNSKMAFVQLYNQIETFYSQPISFERIQREQERKNREVRARRRKDPMPRDGHR